MIIISCHKFQIHTWAKGGATRNSTADIPQIRRSRVEDWTRLAEAGLIRRSPHKVGSVEGLAEGLTTRPGGLRCALTSSIDNAAITPVIDSVMYDAIALKMVTCDKEVHKVPSARAPGLG